MAVYKMKIALKAIVITGTSRGIGYELKKELSDLYFVISLNRIRNNRLKPYIVKERFGIEILGNLNEKGIWLELKKYIKINRLKVTKVFFNAGVNIAEEDNTESIIKSFNENLNTNFNSIVLAIKILGTDFAEKFVYISSMSTIFPSTRNIGYALSKKSAEIFISLINKLSNNKFLLIVLGPVKTDFTSNLESNAGFLKRILFNLVALNKATCAKNIIRYSNMSKNKVFYPKLPFLIYSILNFTRKLSFKSSTFTISI
jgi:short-subunit dehydrogenase